MLLKGDKIKTFSKGARASIKSSQKNAKRLFIGTTKDLIDSYSKIYDEYRPLLALKWMSPEVYLMLPFQKKIQVLTKNFKCILTFIN